MTTAEELLAMDVNEIIRLIEKKLGKQVSVDFSVRQPKNFAPRRIPVVSVAL